MRKRTLLFLPLAVLLTVACGERGLMEPGDVTGSAASDGSESPSPLFNTFPPTATRTFTTDADFDEGTLVGVEHTTVSDQLQLSQTSVTLPFLWTPNTQGTVSKIHTETGKELGRYWVAPHNANPSRTTVDLEGSCWVGNRQAGTVVKIGLEEAGQCIDRNGNGTIQTSRDVNTDGNITSGELLPWGQDECVLYEVVLISGKVGTYVPGTYTGGYDTDYWGTAPRGLAIDASNNLWAGNHSSQRYYYIDGSTGAIVKSVDVSSWSHSAYGAVIDGNGVLWSVNLYDHVLRLDPTDLTSPSTQRISLTHAYGIGLDYDGHVFVSGNGALTRIDATDTSTPIDWTVSDGRSVRGVVATSDNNVWVAGRCISGGAYSCVARYAHDGLFIIGIPGFASPSGVAVDAAGKIWVTDIGSDLVHRIVPATNTTDLSKSVVGSGGHYTYSDMTGIISRTITTKIGTWTVVHDAGGSVPWGTVSWSSDEPEGTSITVRVRSSDDQTTWSSWETATDGALLNSTPDRRYLQIEATLQITTGEDSPVLHDLTVEPAVIEVDVDIKPGSDPNCVNPNAGGRLPVAILATDDFDPTWVDPPSLLLEGASPLRWSWNRDVDDDGDDDLVAHFKTRDLNLEIPDPEESKPLTLTGQLQEEYGGIAIEGEDIVYVAGRWTCETYDDAPGLM